MKRKKRKKKHSIIGRFDFTLSFFYSALTTKIFSSMNYSRYKNKLQSASFLFSYFYVHPPDSVNSADFALSYITFTNSLTSKTCDFYSSSALPLPFLFFIYFTLLKPKSKQPIAELMVFDNNKTMTIGNVIFSLLDVQSTWTQFETCCHFYVEHKWQRWKSIKCKNSFFNIPQLESSILLKYIWNTQKNRRRTMKK